MLFLDYLLYLWASGRSFFLYPRGGIIGAHPFKCVLVEILNLQDDIIIFHFLDVIFPGVTKVCFMVCEGVVSCGNVVWRVWCCLRHGSIISVGLFFIVPSLFLGLGFLQGVSCQGFL